MVTLQQCGKIKKSLKNSTRRSTRKHWKLLSRNEKSHPQNDDSNNTTLCLFLLFLWLTNWPTTGHIDWCKCAIVKQTCNIICECNNKLKCFSCLQLLSITHCFNCYTAVLTFNLLKLMRCVGVVLGEVVGFDEILHGFMRRFFHD